VTETARLDVLETEHRKIFESLEGIKKSLDNNINSVNRLTAKFEAHAMEEKSFELTIRNIDDNVTGMKIEMAKNPMYRTKAIKDEIDPVWGQLRTQDAAFKQFQIDAKDTHDNMDKDITKGIKDWVKTLSAIVWAAAIVIAAASYNSYDTRAKFIDQHIKSNTENIAKLEKIIRTKLK